MLNIHRMLSLAALSTLAMSVSSQETHHWRNSSGEVWKNSVGQCWRDSNWSPATAAPGCDGEIKASAPRKPAVAPVLPPMAAPAAKPVVPTPSAVERSVSFNADEFFDFNKAVLKPQGKVQLNELLAKNRTVNLSAIYAVGHTDSVGKQSYNQRLSLKRAEAVKSYLVSQGIDAKIVHTEGKGELQPAADNSTAEGRKRNRRVELRVIGKDK